MPQVSIPIIDQLIHPSFALLSRVALPANPYTGFFTAVPPQGPLAFTYGIVLKTSVVPIKWGLRLGYPQRYEPALAEVASTYTDLNGLAIIQQVEDANYDDYIYFWREPLPTLVSIYMMPGISLDLYWMQT